MEKSFNFKSLILRYSILFVIGLFFLKIFYIIFSQLTIKPSFFLINLFFNSILVDNVIIVSFQSNYSIIEVIDACISGAAYYLFFILNLSTPDIKFKKRLNMIGFSFLVFLILNVLRIFLFSMLFIFDFIWFEFTHRLFWYVVSVVFVVGIWFYQVKKFKIKDTPFYSDLKQIYNLSAFNKKSKKI